MTPDEIPVVVPTFRGSEEVVLAQLWGLCVSDIDSDAVVEAIQLIREGNRSVTCAGERFEVVDPEWSVVQDVFGCEKGRDCTDATPEHREQFESLIARYETQG